MRLPVLIASGAVLVALAYRYYGRNITPTGKEIFSWSFILVILAVLGNTPLSGIADMFSYIVILIIVLNDGYELLRSF